MLAKALVRGFELLLKGLDVKPIVAPVGCLPRPSQDTLELSLEPIQVRLGQVSVAIDRPLQPAFPGPIGIIHYGVENLLSLGIQQLGRDKLSGIMHSRCRHRFKPDRPVFLLSRPVQNRPACRVYEREDKDGFCLRP
jgi:hypothetical protein